MILEDLDEVHPGFLVSAQQQKESHSLLLHVAWGELIHHLCRDGACSCGGELAAKSMAQAQAPL